MQLHDHAIVPKHVYNMDETGVPLSVLNYLNVPVGRQDLLILRCAEVRRASVTAVEANVALSKYTNLSNVSANVQIRQTRQWGITQQ